MRFILGTAANFSFAAGVQGDKTGLAAIAELVILSSETKYTIGDNGHVLQVRDRIMDSRFWVDRSTLNALIEDLTSYRDSLVKAEDEVADVTLEPRGAQEPTNAGGETPLEDDANQIELPLEAAIDA